MTVENRYEHIVLDENQVAYIEGTRMKVIQLVLNHLAYNWTPEELKEQHPHLTMGQIHSAMAYCWDHKHKIDETIEHDLKLIDEYKEKLASSSLQERLQSI